MTYIPPAHNSINAYLETGYTPPVYNAINVDLAVSDGATRPNMAIVNQGYSLRNGAAIDMPYTILFTRTAYLNMTYGLKLGMSLVMYFGDAPLLKQIQNQYYSDAPLLKRSVDMKYGDLLMLQKSVEMPYHILKPLQSIMDAKYGINGESLQAIMDQNYSLSEYNLLCKKLDMPYLLQSDAMVQTVSTSLSIAEKSVAFTHISIERNHTSYFITGDAHLAEISEYFQVKVGDKVAATCNATTYNLIVVSKKRSRPKGTVTTYIVNFESPVVLLSAPWYRPILQEFEPALAETIINGLAGSLAPIEYLTETFPVLADTLYANDEDARTVIRKLTQSVGAFMQSNPDGSIRVEALYPTPVSEWANAEPDYYLTDERNFVSQDESPVRNSGENKYLVGNQLSSEHRTWTEKESIADNETAVFGFQVPWGCEPVYGLTHSGGEQVQNPEYLGVVEENITEQVEFVAGFATTSKPIYRDFEVDWLREQLGSITFGEDGNLEAELKTGSTDGYSLALISYTTKYHKWIVKNDVAEDVQYLLWVGE